MAFLALRLRSTPRGRRKCIAGLSDAIFPLGGYELVKIVRGNASMEVDWFDNSMHDAFVDATDEAFESTVQSTAEEDRDAFKRRFLQASYMSD